MPDNNQKLTVPALMWNDKLLPNQAHQLALFKDYDDVNPAMRIAAMCSDFTVDPMLQFTTTLMPVCLASVTEMVSHPVTLAILSMLIKLFDPRSILEIGTFVGLGTMTMAKAASKDAQIMTIEPFASAASTARYNFTLNGFSNIHLIEGDAVDILHSGSQVSDNPIHPNPYDFVYMDGGKQNYEIYLTLLQPYLHSLKHVIVIDDVFFNGDVLNVEPLTEKGKGCQAALVWARQHLEYHSTLLPIGNGLLIMMHGFN